MTTPERTTQRTRMSDDSAIIDAHAGDDLSPLGGEWEVDPTHSALEFVARYAMFTLVRGRFTSFSGAVVIDPLHPEATQIDVDVDASSVDSAMAVRDAHLRGEEFFDVDRYPSITFRARGATLLGAGRYAVGGIDDPRHHTASAARRRSVRSSAGRDGQSPARLQGDGQAATCAVEYHVERTGPRRRRRPC